MRRAASGRPFSFQYATAPRPVSAAWRCSSARYDERTSGPENTDPNPSASPCSRNQRNSSGCTQRSICRVLRRGLQVLADRDDVDPVRAKVAHRLDDLVVRLAEPDDDPGLREHRIAGDLLGPLEEPERLVVARLRAAHACMESADGLDVVVEDLGSCGEHRRKRFLFGAEEVRREDLDLRLRQLALDRPDRCRVVRRATIGEVVAVDRRDDDVRELHLRRRLRQAERLEGIGRTVRLARVHVAVPARARARVAEDLERRRPAPPALADVRAARLLADRDEPTLAHEALHLEVLRVGARRAHLHPLGPPRTLRYGKRPFHRD